MRQDLIGILDRVTMVRGVTGALLVGEEDGLVVAESLMEGVRGNAVAALAASLYSKCSQATATLEIGASNFLHFEAELGGLIVMKGPDDILVVAIAEADVNVGLVRLEMVRAVEAKI